MLDPSFACALYNFGGSDSGGNLPAKWLLSSYDMSARGRVIFYYSSVE